ncbi:metallophosphoesterase [Methylosoma difficile]
MTRHDRILFAGDPHGNFQPLINAVHKHQPEAVILLGDYDLDKPLEDYLGEIAEMTQIWWIAGNHDFQSPCKHRNLFQSAFKDNSLHLKVTEIAGLKIAGLGGIFLGRVWYPPKEPKWTDKQHFLVNQPQGLKNGGMTLKYLSAIWPDEFQQLKALNADILVTHEAPGSHRHGFQAITELAVAMGVKQLFHGHLHENYSRIIKHNIKVHGVANHAVSDLLGNLCS